MLRAGDLVQPYPAVDRGKAIAQAMPRGIARVGHCLDEMHTLTVSAAPTVATVGAAPPGLTYCNANVASRFASNVRMAPSF